MHTAARLQGWQTEDGGFCYKNRIDAQFVQNSCRCPLIATINFSLQEGYEDGKELYDVSLNFVYLLSWACTAFYLRVVLVAFHRSVT